MSPPSHDKRDSSADSAPSTPATTVINTPSPPSQKSASVPPAMHYSHQNSQSPTSSNLRHSVKYEYGHHCNMNSLIPKAVPQDTLHLPQKPVKIENSHLNYAPSVGMMGKLGQVNKQEYSHTKHCQGPVNKSIYDKFYGTNPLNEPLNPHPHLTQPTIWVNMFPPDVSEQSLADSIVGCLPIRVKLDHAVAPEMRLLPGMYYDWMSKTGTIEFTTLPLAERALAVLVNHTIFTPRGVWFSPYPPPYILPNPDPPTAVRYIRPTTLMLLPNLPPNPKPEDTFRAYFPTPSEVYDAVRPWGSIRSVNSYVTDTLEEMKVQGRDQIHQWLARVEFWYEDEAKKFDVGFGKTASLLKGWQIYIHSSSLEPTVPGLPINYQAPPRMINQNLEPLQIPQDATNIQYNHPSTDLHQMGIMGIPDTTIPPTPTSADMGRFPSVMGYDQIPQTPPPINYVPPWAAYNMFAAVDILPEDYGGGGPVTPDRMSRRMSRTSMSSLNGRGRTWSLTVGESPDGELRPTGLVADDGTIIQHGPGQHIRPAPYFGPGSNSVSGLVDYSNVFVKNLDPDINSYYLEEVFSNVGQVVSARVMRDDQGRSRGYGFVSFHSPEQAANAIAVLHNQKLGRGAISVTLHEPRKLRPEKIAERVANGLPILFGRDSSNLPRRSMSPVRNDKGRGRTVYAEEPKTPNSTDEIRLLSPNSRKTALAKKISSRVRNYARSNDIPDTHLAQALNSLIQQDLKLIPLLNDKVQLDLKIAESFSQVNSDPSLAPNESIIRPTNQDLINLREEVKKIDPGNINEIMPIMLEMLSPSDWESLWSQQTVARKYGLAKQILEKNKENDQAQVETEVPVKVDDSPDTCNEDQLVSLEGLTIPSFCSLPAEQIIINLQTENGPKIFAQLGIVEPSLVEKNNNKSWTNRVMGRNKVERGVEIANMLGKKIDTDTLKRSQKLKIIKGLINAEDEKALCELMIYPALLNAKIKSFVESQGGN